MNPLIKPLTPLKAFTLVELIVVIIITSILAAVAIPHFSSKGDFSSRAAASELITHLRFTQQLAMHNTSRCYRAIISDHSVSVEKSNTNSCLSPAVFSPISSPQGDSYPYQIDSAVTFAPATTLTFNSYGETSAATISLTPLIGESVCVETTGFARLC